jgi:hypothetical protein
LSRESKDSRSCGTAATCDDRKLAFIWLSIPVRDDADSISDKSNQKETFAMAQNSHLPSICSGYLDTQERTRPQRCLKIAGSVTGLSVNRSEKRFVVSWEAREKETEVEATAGGELNVSLDKLATDGSNWVPSFHVAAFDMETFACLWENEMQSRSDVLFSLSIDGSLNIGAGISNRIEADDDSGECFALISHGSYGKGSISAHQTSHRNNIATPISSTSTAAEVSACDGDSEVQCVGHWTTSEPLLLWTSVDRAYLAVVTLTSVALVGWLNERIPGDSGKPSKLELSLATVAELHLEEGEVSIGADS